MKSEHIKYVVIGVILLLVVVTVVRGGSALKRAKALTEELQDEVDSLQEISNEYDELSKKYELLYRDMEITSKNLHQLRIRMKEITEQHSTSLSKIKSELSGIITEYDSIIRPLAIDTISIDTLRFD